MSQTKISKKAMNAAFQAQFAAAGRKQQNMFFPNMFTAPVAAKKATGATKKRKAPTSTGAESSVPAPKKIATKKAKKTVSVIPAPNHPEEDSDNDEIVIVKDEILSKDSMRAIAAEDAEKEFIRCQRFVKLYKKQQQTVSDANDSSAVRTAKLLASALQIRSSSEGMKKKLLVFRTDEDAYVAEKNDTEETREKAKKNMINMEVNTLPGLVAKGKSDFEAFQKAYTGLSASEQAEIWAFKEGRLSHLQDCKSFEELHKKSSADESISL